MFAIAHAMILKKEIGLRNKYSVVFKTKSFEKSSLDCTGVKLHSLVKSYKRTKFI